MSESKNESPVKDGREYFENGCLCIEDGSLTKLDVSVPDAEALTHYENNCKCSRNYK